MAKTDPATVSVVHLGCARNLVDSEVILGRMAEEGLVISGDPDHASTVVLNTCSFIGPAREESENAIRDLLRRKKKGQLDHVVVAGCLVQKVRRELAERFPEVDLFAEISDYKALAKSVATLSKGGSVPRYLEGLREPEREGARLISTPRSYAYLRISHGCDHQCSFCAIPSIRGKHRSKKLDDVLSEARELVQHGSKELVLVAEDSTAWGRDMGLELPDLVAALSDVPRLARIRVMYAYPNRFPWELTRLMRERDNVARYLDIPVQHASTAMLRAMRRHGSGEQMRGILDRLREEVPGIVLRTTVLVGFPGETESDVDELVSLVETYGFGRLGAFTYSPEQGTHGYDLPGRVPADVAQRRLERVLAARDRVLRASQGAFVGQRVRILVDEWHAEAQTVVGRPEWDAPESDLIVVASGVKKAKVGDFLEVEVAKVDPEHNLLAVPAKKL
ncbi:MAG: ribosomal protein methylthiotransferase RimO [Planctomycetota bacterium]|jgi:ribosomal protein S12 methylthiotransferase